LTIAGLRYGVSRDRLAIEQCAQLGRAALGIEVDPVEAEALFKSIRPFIDSFSACFFHSRSRSTVESVESIALP
jgi:hypothetical protein